jgi:hypothetical protein
MRLPHGTLLPVGRGLEMLMPADLLIAIGPAVIAEFWSVLELVLGDVRDVSFVRAVVFDRIPRQGIMAVAEAHEATKAHHGVADIA